MRQTKGRPPPKFTNPTGCHVPPPTLCIGRLLLQDINNSIVPLCLNIRTMSMRNVMPQRRRSGTRSAQTPFRSPHMRLLRLVVQTRRERIPRQADAADRSGIPHRRRTRKVRKGGRGRQIQDVVQIAVFSGCGSRSGHLNMSRGNVARRGSVNEGIVRIGRGRMQRGRNNRMPARKPSMLRERGFNSSRGAHAGGNTQVREPRCAR